jgi:hypothetical protein
MPGSDSEILARINDLVDEERSLRARHHETPLDDADTSRLERLESELDQCWDLLNQRRALTEFGMDPEQARVRDSDVIEDYRQ